MCSLHDSALMCCGLWRCLTQQPESQDLSQRQKIPWRSEDTLWRRSSCEEFCVSRHQIASDHHSKEKPVRKHNKPPLSLTSDVAPALDSSEKERTHKDVSVGCSHSRLCAAQDREIPKHQLFLGSHTMLTITPCCGSTCAPQTWLG